MYTESVGELIWQCAILWGAVCDHHSLIFISFSVCFVSTLFRLVTSTSVSYTLCCILKTFGSVISPLFVLLSCKEWMESPGDHSFSWPFQFDFFLTYFVQECQTAHQCIACTVRTVMFLKMPKIACAWRTTTFFDHIWHLKVEHVDLTSMSQCFTRHY